MSTTYRKGVTSIGAALVLALAVAAPTSAKPLEQEHYEGTNAGTFDACGPTYEFESEFRGLFKLKSGRGGDLTPYLSDNYDWETVIRNPATGAWITEQGNGLYKDLRITRLHGTVYRFIAQESGSPYTIRTADGTKVIKDRGLLRYQFDVDTKGDADLDNDEFIEGSDLLVADHGSHPIWHMTGEDYCAVINGLLD
jgi:hypothetical protein